jgi:hypothetical protein
LLSLTVFSKLKKASPDVGGRLCPLISNLLSDPESHAIAAVQFRFSNACASLDEALNLLGFIWSYRF